MTSQPLTTSINMQTPNGTTPTVPSLTAAIDHATAWAKAHPTHRWPSFTPRTGSPTAAAPPTPSNRRLSVAARGAMANPPIPTYVLGVGPNLANLNSIAAQRRHQDGVPGRHLGQRGQPAERSAQPPFAARPRSTARTSSPPPPKGQTLDPNLVNIEYTTAAGAVAKMRTHSGQRRLRYSQRLAILQGWQIDQPVRQDLYGREGRQGRQDPGALRLSHAARRTPDLSARLLRAAAPVGRPQ